MLIHIYLFRFVSGGSNSSLHTPDILSLKQTYMPTYMRTYMLLCKASRQPCTTPPQVQEIEWN